MRKIILTFSIVFVFITLVISQDNVWNGNVDNNWGDDGNWSLGHIPTAIEDVKVWAASAEVIVDINAVAKSVEYQGTTFTINGSITLTINGATFQGFRNTGGEVLNNGILIINNSTRSGLLNQGTDGSFSNVGTLTIDGTTGNYNGILNRTGAAFENTGTINIDNTGFNGIKQESTEPFTNKKTIYIGLSGNIGENGIDCTETFDNQDEIVIGSFSGSIDHDGIINSGDFTNDGGTINIDYTNGASLTYSAIKNTSIFTQKASGSITIGSNNYLGVSNLGTFNNTVGIIIVGLVKSSNIYNASAGNFTNSSSMDLNGTESTNVPCIDNRATFTNSGSISMDDSKGQGIRNFNVGSTFTNSASLNIGQSANISTNGIENNGTFSNSGLVNIGSNLFSIGGRGIYSIGTFTNNGGTIYIDNIKMGGHIALQNNGGTVENTGNGNIYIGTKYRCEHRGIDNNGTFNNQDGSTITIDDINYQAIYVSGGTFSNYGTYKHVTTEDWTIIGGSGSFINKSTGKVYSAKIIDNSFFTNEGELHPGQSPGILQFANGFAPTSTAVYNCEIAGTGGANGGDQDQIRVTSGTTTLDGTLNLDFGAFTPADDDEFIVLEFVGTLSGTFSTVNNLPIDWTIDYGTKLPGKVVIYGKDSEVPIDLVFFNANNIDNSIQLNWQTASEKNNDYFQIEYSNNGKTFSSIGEIDGQRASTELKNYSFIHKRPSNGMNYYRLKQYDLDGRFEYSDIVNVTISTKELIVFPNPAKDYISIDGNIDFNNITVFDANGKKHFINKISNDRFNVSNLPIGIYFGEINNNRHIKFVID